MSDAYLFPRALVIQFAKTPVLGAVKTRMQPYLSEQQSLWLHCRMLEDTYARLRSATVAPLELWISEQDEERYFQTLKPSPVLRPQIGDDLGERMYSAFIDGLERYRTVVLVGSDCPFLNGEVVSRALGYLEAGYDCVLGPATDGGYVLMALARVVPSLFEGLAWGGSQVLQQTRSRLRDAGFKWSELAPLPDIDCPRDLTWITPLKQYDKLILSS